jgi:tetratricopeptide (TPR) repeat protein
MFTKLASLAILLAALCGYAYASTDQWIEVRSPHFTVITDVNEKQGRHILDQFERMRWMFQTIFPKVNVDPVQPIVVVAAKNRKVFQTIKPETFLAKGQMNISGLFMNRVDKNYILLRLDAEFEHPYEPVFHEYTHLQFKDFSQWMPVWLNEGLAEFFQNTEIRDKDVVVGEASVNNILYLRQQNLIPLEVLFKVDDKSPYYHEEDKGSIFYAEVWALTHYLYVTDKQKGTNKVGDYMTLLSKGEDPLTAAEKVFGNLRQLQKTLQDYIQQSNYMQFTLSSAAAAIDESTYKVRTLKQAESDAVRADVLTGVGRVKDARELLDAVLKADPENLQARETMGYLEFQDRNMDAAREWYAEAIKQGSQNYFVYFNFATLSIGQMSSEQSKDIESSLRTAVRLNPRFAPAYEQLASFLMTREQFDDAEALLQTLLKSTTDPGDGAMGHRMMAQIQEVKTARAQFAADSKTQMDALREKETVVTTGMVDVVPKHPTEPADGLRHEALGVIRGVQCSYPAVIEFKVESAKKTVSLYSNNYYKLEYSTLGFMLEGALNPCKGIEGRNARVQFTESSDKTVDGQVVAVELRK